MLRSTTTISSNGPTKKGVSPDFVFKHLNSSVNIDTLTCFTDFSESFIDIGLRLFQTLCEEKEASEG
jgi:hypothetical protein